PLSPVLHALTVRASAAMAAAIANLRVVFTDTPAVCRGGRLRGILISVGSGSFASRAITPARARLRNAAGPMPVIAHGDTTRGPQSAARVPPSITIVCPLTNAPPGEASQTTAPATSSGVPKRPSGVLARRV